MSAGFSPVRAARASMRFARVFGISRPGMFGFVRVGVRGNFNTLRSEKSLVGAQSGLTALLVPNVTHEALPAARLLREPIFHLLRLAIARDRFLHLLVDLAQRQATGAFQLFGVVFGHDYQGVRGAPYAKLQTHLLREIQCPATLSVCSIA